MRAHPVQALLSTALFIGLLAAPASAQSLSAETGCAAGSLWSGAPSADGNYDGGVEVLVRKGGTQTLQDSAIFYAFPANEQTFSALGTVAATLPSDGVGSGGGIARYFDPCGAASMLMKGGDSSGGRALQRQGVSSGGGFGLDSGGVGSGGGITFDSDGVGSSGGITILGAAADSGFVQRMGLLGLSTATREAYRYDGDVLEIPKVQAAFAAALKAKGVELPAVIVVTIPPEKYPDHCVYAICLPSDWLQ